MRSRIFSASTGYVLILFSAWVVLCLMNAMKLSGHSLELRLISAVLPFICFIVYGLFFLRIKMFFIWAIVLLLPGDMYLVWVLGEKTLGQIWFVSGAFGVYIGISLLQYRLPVTDVSVGVNNLSAIDDVGIQFREMRIYAEDVRRTRNRLIRFPQIYYERFVYFEVNERIVRFTQQDFRPEQIKCLVKFPERFVVGDGPFLSGLDFPDSLLAEIAEKHLVPAGCLVIIDDENLLGTIYPDEVPAFQQWIQRVFH